MANAKTSSQGASTQDQAQGAQGGTAAAPAAKPVKHVKMRRHKPQFPGGPVEADVHPAEVENYAQGGWFLPEGPGSQSSGSQSSGSQSSGS